MKSAVRTLCAIVALGLSTPVTVHAVLNPDRIMSVFDFRSTQIPLCDSTDYTVREKRSIFDIAQQFYGRIVGYENYLNAHMQAGGLPNFLRAEYNGWTGQNFFNNDGYPAQLAIVEHYVGEIARLNGLDVSSAVKRGTVLKLPYGGRIECGRSGKIRRE